MSEFRIDPLSRKGVIIAGERANRPFSQSCNAQTTACPFCKGNEEQTPSATDVVCYPGTDQWAIRCVPNRYPAVSPCLPWSEQEFQLSAGADSFYNMTRQAACGRHEVIVESPRHDKRCSLLGEEQWKRLIRFYAFKVHSFYEDQSCQYVQLFKNQGLTAGASLEHVHSQIIGLPMVPPAVQNELANLERYANQTGRLFWTDILNKELHLGKRIVETTENFVVFCPFLSRFAGETWIMPRIARPDMENVSNAVLDELGALLSRFLSRLESALIAFNSQSAPMNCEPITPSYNIVYRTAPRIGGRIPELFSWRIEIIPRINAIAGFELGTGYTINVLPPEDFRDLLLNSKL